MDDGSEVIQFRLWVQRRSFQTGKWGEWKRHGAYGYKHEMLDLAATLQAIRAEYLVLRVDESPIGFTKETP